MGAEPYLWATEPRKPLLATREVHVWWARLEDVPEGLVAPTLSPGELERARAILAPQRSLRWARSRTLLRALLARYLEVEAARIELATGPHGKPALTRAGADRDAGRLAAGPPYEAPPRAEPDIAFSLSHSRGYALCAIARELRVGVDLELLRPVPRAIPLARRALGAECTRELEGLPAGRRDAAFLRAWVRHEAQVKCTGTGLLAAAGAGPSLWTADLPAGQLGVAALALDRTPRGLRLRRWRPDVDGRDLPEKRHDSPREERDSPVNQRFSEDADGDRLREAFAFDDDRQQHVEPMSFA